MREWTRRGVLAVALCGGMVLGEGRSWAQKGGAPLKGEVQLEEVVVTATREETEVVRVPANVSIIRREEIERSPARTVADLLRTQPGLFVTNTSTGPFDFDVEPRGFNNGGGNGSRFLVLVDGRRVNEPNSSVADWATIPLENVERIELVRGPVSAVYGDNAVAGVINIITRKGEGKPRIDVGGTLGGFPAAGQHVGFSGSTAGFSYALFEGGQAGDGFRDHSHFRANNASAKFAYTLLPGVTLSLKGGSHWDRRQRPGSLTLEEIGRLGPKASVAPLDQDQRREENVDPGLEVALGEWGRVKAFGFFNRVASDAQITSPGSGESTIGTRANVRNGSMQYTLDRALRDHQNRFTVGIDLAKEDTRAESVTNFPAFFFVQRQFTTLGRRTRGYFVQDEFSLTPSLILSGGYRYDSAAFGFRSETADLLFGTVTPFSATRAFNANSPRAALTYLYAEGSSAYVSWGKSFRYPNSDELTGFFGFVPGLEPEHATNYEVGVKHRFGEIARANASLYRQEVKSEIFFNPLAINPFSGFPGGVNQNFPKIRHQGLEASIDVRPWPWLLLRGGYTFSDTEIRRGPFTGSQLPITPRHWGNAGAELTLAGGFTLTGTALFVGNRFLANDVENRFGQLHPYQMVNARLGYTPPLPARWGKLTAFVGVNNLFDRSYFEFGGVSSTSLPFGRRIGFNPAAGREVLAGLEYTY